MAIGRPKTAPEVVAERCARLKEALTATWGGVDEAAQSIGMPYWQARELIRDNEDLHEHLMCVRDQLADKIRHRVEMAAVGERPLPSNEVTMTIFGAKTLAGLQERQQVEHSGQISYGKPPKDLGEDSPLRVLDFPVLRNGTDGLAGGTSEDAPQTDKNGPD